MRFCLALALASMLGCFHDQHVAGPSGGSSARGWQEVTSTHFVLYTDQGAFMARQALEELEHDVSMLQALAFPSVTLPPEPIDVVLLDLDGLQTLAGDKQLGGSFHGSLDATERRHLLTAVVPPGGVFGGLGELRTTVLHEITHSFVRRAIPHAPTWLNEGIACYWETLEFDGDAQEAIVGRPPPLNTLLVDWAPLNELVTGDARTFYRRANRAPAYAMAWGVVHFLYEHSPDTLVSYEALLRQGVSDQVAWQDAFGVPPAAFDKRLHELYDADAPLARRVPRPPMAAVDPRSERTLTPAEVHLLWARVAENGGKEGLARMQAQVDAAAQLEPESPAVLVWQARLAMRHDNWPEAVTRLEHALQLRPDDRNALALLTDVRQRVPPQRQDGSRDDDALDALYARLAAPGGSASDLARAAEYELSRNGVERARPLAEAAVTRNPECVACLETLATIRDAAHDERGAADAEARAVAAWPYEDPPTAQLQRLEGYRAAATRAH